MPDLDNVIVSAFDPEQVVLFGSVADGSDGPDSDIDLLVVLGHAAVNATALRPAKRCRQISAQLAFG